MRSIWQGIVTLIVLIIFATFHEYAHGWAAYRLGDSTAKRSGRLSLNPLAHIDLFGTIILPAMLILSTGFAFGYAKPVPVNPHWLRNPKRDMIWVGLAGPASNVAWALVLIFVIKTGIFSQAGSRLYLKGAPYFLLLICLYINILLLVFNMIPIPPLDGSRVVEGLLPDRYAEKYARIKPYGFMILMGIIALGWISPRLSIIGRLLSFSIRLVERVFSL